MNLDEELTAACSELPAPTGTGWLDQLIKPESQATGDSWLDELLSEACDE